MERIQSANGIRGYMGLYVAISQRTCSAGYMGLYVTAISQSRGKSGRCHYAYTKRAFRAGYMGLYVA